MCFWHKQLQCGEDYEAMKKICFSCAGVVFGGYALFFALSFIGAGVMAFVAMFLYLACIVVLCTHLILKALHENREKND